MLDSKQIPTWKELPYNAKLKERANNAKLKERAKALRKAGNLPEVLFWQQVKRKQFLGLDFDRQKIIGNYIVDFYCKKLAVVIEIDGSSHDDKFEYDQRRDEFLAELRLKVTHIEVKEVMGNMEGVLKFLKEELEGLL